MGAECSYIAGTRTVCEVNSEHVKHALFLGGMPPRKILKISATRLNLKAMLANHSNEKYLAISHRYLINHVI